MAQYKKCGIIVRDGEVYDLVSDTATGEVVMISDLLGNCYLSEITVLDPNVTKNEKVLHKMLEHFQCDGIIMSERHLITLHGDEAQYRAYVDTDAVVQTVQFDTDMECMERISSYDD